MKCHPNKINLLKLFFESINETVVYHFQNLFETGNGFENTAKYINSNAVFI